MTVVVTGAAGHIGGNLVRALLDQGHTVRALVFQDRRALEGLDVELVQGDLLDPAFVDEALRGAEVAYHLAATITLNGGRMNGTLRVNVEGTRNVAQACLAQGVGRLIHFSSVHALAQHPLDAPLTEERALADSPEDLVYDQSKAAGERVVLEAAEQGLDAVILNPSAVIGPYDFKPSHTGELILDLIRRRIPALVPNGYTWVDVRDVVDAALAAWSRADSGHRYLLAGHYLGLPEFSALVGRVANARTPRLVVPMWAARLGAPFVTGWCSLRGTRPLFTRESLAIVSGNTRMDCCKAEAALGFRARPLEETVQDTVTWLRQAGQLG